jgi:hypothetical protein
MNVGNGLRLTMAAVLGALYLAGAGAEAAAFRCGGGGLVSEGDSKAKVLLECGQPMLKEKVARVETGATVEAETKTGKKGKRKKTTRRKTQAVERWSYNCGENDFIYHLSFQGGVLTKVETAGRGKGPSRCR